MGKRIMGQRAIGRVKDGRRRPTCTDIARMSGVCVGTVSRVINHPDKVSPVIRDKVLANIARTGYRPSSAAQMLVRRRYETVGVVAEDYLERTYYVAGLIQGVAHAAGDAGYRVAVGTADVERDVSELLRIPMLANHSVDGLVLDWMVPRGNLDGALAGLGVPCVLVNVAGRRTHNAVMPDDVAAGRMGVEYLWARGHRRIGYLPAFWNNAHDSHADRMRGYAEAMSTAGLPLISGWCEMFPDGLSREARDRETGRRLERLIVQERCTAVIYYGGQTGIVLRYCAEAGRSVPDDVSLVSCDDSPGAEDAVVPVTSLCFDRWEIGRKAFAMLRERIENGGDVTTNWVTPIFRERASVRRLA